MPALGKLREGDHKSEAKLGLHSKTLPQKKKKMQDQTYDIFNTK
jgi:hypothetical protein